VNEAHNHIVVAKKTPMFSTNPAIEKLFGESPDKLYLDIPITLV
jgi:hypothetical protein